MMNHRYKLFGVAILFLVIGCAWSQAAEISEPITMAEVPPIIKTAIRKEAGNAPVESIDKITDHSKVRYEIEVSRGEETLDFTLFENGQLLDEETSLAQTPEAIQAAIKTNAAGGSIEDVTKVYDDGKISYSVDIIKNDKKRTFTLDDKGTLSDWQMLPGELPDAVHKTVTKESAGAKLGDMTKDFDKDGITYEVELNPDGNTRTITMNEQGVIVSDERDTNFSETPDAVQKTIHDQLKDGTLGAITKSADEDGVTFDVDMKRNGKWDTVTIGDKGQVKE